MKVAFRVDASIRIGTGHVMRCLTLADELASQGHECIFVCRAHLGHLGDLIRGKGHKLILLPLASTGSESTTETSSFDDYQQWLGTIWQEDAGQTREAIAPVRPEWLVVDHYALGAKWERALASVVGKILVIDDLANRAHECALLLDQNLGRAASDYDELLPADCQRLIGPRYALLRPEFSECRERSLERREHPELKRILISLGGVDRSNRTCDVLGALEESALLACVELDIVMGATAPYLKEVRQHAARLPVKATVSVNVTDMAERMCLADLSIGAAGSTSWERCCLGLPTVLVVQAENQAAGAKALEATGAALIVGDPEQLRTLLPSLLDGLNDSRRLHQLSVAASAISDGSGALSVVHSMTAEGGGDDKTSTSPNDRGRP